MGDAGAWMDLLQTQYWQSDNRHRSRLISHNQTPHAHTLTDSIFMKCVVWNTVWEDVIFITQHVTRHNMTSFSWLLKLQCSTLRHAGLSFLKYRLFGGLKLNSLMWNLTCSFEQFIEFLTQKSASLSCDSVLYQAIMTTIKQAYHYCNKSLFLFCFYNVVYLTSWLGERGRHLDIKHC